VNFVRETAKHHLKHDFTNRGPRFVFVFVFVFVIHETAKHHLTAAFCCVEWTVVSCGPSSDRLLPGALDRPGENLVSNGSPGDADTMTGRGGGGKDERIIRASDRNEDIDNYG
jgi:hypothetical protein